MNILLVEDDDIKSRQLFEYTLETVKNAQVEVVRSVNEAMKAIWTGNYNLILIDMSLPTYTIQPEYETGGRPQNFGGREILRFMKRKGKQTPSIVVTQFERFGSGSDAMDIQALAEILKAEHGALFGGVIYYHPSSSKWKVQLKQLMTTILRLEESND